MGNQRTWKLTYKKYVPCTSEQVVNKATPENAFNPVREFSGGQAYPFIIHCDFNGVRRYAFWPCGHDVLFTHNEHDATYIANHYRDIEVVEITGTESENYLYQQWEAHGKEDQDAMCMIPFQNKPSDRL